MLHTYLHMVCNTFLNKPIFSLLFLLVILYPFLLVFCTHAPPLNPSPPPPLSRSSCLISHLTLFLCASKSFRSQPPQASSALWPFLPLQDCISPASCSNLSRTILEAELALWQKKRTAGKKTLLTKEDKHLQMSVGGFAKASACSHVELPTNRFPLRWGGQEACTPSQTTEQIQGNAAFSLKSSSSPHPLYSCPDLCLSFSLPWPVARTQKSQVLPTAVSQDSETKRLIGMHLEEVLGLGDSGKIITARSFICLLIFLNLYGRSTSPAVPECLFYNHFNNTQ